MALFRKFFYRKPPDGLLEISDRVHVFDYCFTTDVLEENEYRVYINSVIAQLREHSPDATFMVFNFREGEQQSQISSIMSEYDTTVMDYPRHYEGCPLLTMEMVHHFLRSSESWLSLGHNNVLLMHCERGGWPVLAFMLAGLMIYTKQYRGEMKTLDMVYKQAPRELLQLLSPLNPLPSQLRYLQYISRRNVGSEWPPLDRALTLDCVILRVLPNFDRETGCRPIFRIYGQDPFIAADRTPKVLFSTPKRSKAVRLYKADCELVKIDIHCHIQGDVVLECISLDEDLEREEMMFRVMFNTAFIRSNILILNRDEIDILWDAQDRFPKEFRAEILLSEMDSASSIITMDLVSGDEKEGLPVEAFAKVQEIFSNVDWLDPSGDAALHVLQHIASSNALQLDAISPKNTEGDADSEKSSPGVLKEIFQSQEANDGRGDAALRVLQHIASSKTLQEKLDALSPKEFDSDDISQKSSPNVLKDMLLSQEGNDVMGDVALRVLQHIASSKALQEKLDALSPKKVDNGDLKQNSSSGMLKQIPHSQEVNDGRRDNTLSDTEHTASSNALQEKQYLFPEKELDDAGMLKQISHFQEANDRRGDNTPSGHQHIDSSNALPENQYLSSENEPNDAGMLVQISHPQETSDRKGDNALPDLQYIASSNALQEKQHDLSEKEVDDDVSQKSSPSEHSERLQSHETNDGRGDAAVHVVHQLTTPNALPEKLDGISPKIVESDAVPPKTVETDATPPKEVESDAMFQKPSPVCEELLVSHESIDRTKNSSLPAEKQETVSFNATSPDSTAKSQDIKLDNVEAAVHPSEARPLTEHMPRFESNASSLDNALQFDRSNDGIKKPSPPAPRQQHIPFRKHSHESNTKGHNMKLNDAEAAVHPSQPKSLTQYMPKSRSSPVSLNNSLQNSPKPISRYHSAPSALGITALLHDHAAFGSSEVTHSVTRPPIALSLSSAAAHGGSEPTRPKTGSATSVPPLLSTLPSSDTTRVSAVVPPPPPPPPPLLSSPLPSSASSRTKVSVPPPPPPPTPSVCPPSTTGRVTPSPPSSPAMPQPQPTLPRSDSPDLLTRPVPEAVPPSPSTSASLLAPAPEQQPMPTNNPPSLTSATTPSPHSPHLASSVKAFPNFVPPPPPPPPPSSLGTTFPVGSPRGESNTPLSVPRGPPPPPPPPMKEIISETPQPPPPPPVITPSPSPEKTKVNVVSAPPPPPPPSRPGAPPTPPPAPPSLRSEATSSAITPSAPPPPPPPSSSGASVTPSAPPPPPPPNGSPNDARSEKPSFGPPVPPPPAPSSSQFSSPGSKAPAPPANGMPGSALGVKGRSAIRPGSRSTITKRSNLKPLHWVKVTRAMSGSLWAEAQRTDEASRAPEFDMSELESLFSTAMPNSESRGSTSRSSGRSSLGQKSDKVQLIDLRRANNCEIMLTKVKMPLPDLMSSLLALDDSVLDADQIDNLIKFCPTKEEMELLKAFTGDLETLGKCEQYFLELMKVPRVEAKLRVFSFKIQFRTQVGDLSKNLNTVNSAAGEIRNSAKLKRIMQTILSLGNALNQGTARGSAVGFRLDSLLKLTDTRARNNKMTLMHYLCKVLAEKLPELLDFQKDLVSLEVASKIQLKTLAEEMQAISKGLEKVEQELTASENDGPVSEIFRKTLKEFLVGAEAEVRALTSLYSNVGRNADALALYFGEDPARCPFEQVVSTLLNFVRMFVRAHEENCKQLELEKKKAQKEAENEKAKLGTPKKEPESLSRSSSSKKSNVK